MTAARRVRVLFLVEGFTDIRFVVGLSEISALTMIVPSRAYRESQLAERVLESGASVKVVEIPGGRLRFQSSALRQLWKHVADCDVVLAQELLRGALDANVIGLLRRTPVVAYVAISPLEYFLCRRERGEIGPVTAWLGAAVIQALVSINGRLATRCLGVGPYLKDVASSWCPRTDVGLYYGVDIDCFRPADLAERNRLRDQLNLRRDKFIVVLSSRVSHEKDPETVVRAVALARSRGLDAVLLNLGGGYQEFLRLPSRLGIKDADAWVYARPAVHPMKDLADFFRAADVVALASLAEGAGLSTLEALACETPVAATAVGGMTTQLSEYATLTPRRDVPAMAEALLAIAANPDAARARAGAGREYVCRCWNREKAFADLAVVLSSAAKRRQQMTFAIR
jgi:glycosyltransferase involved in cell wall biosynthesis